MVWPAAQRKARATACGLYTMQQLSRSWVRSNVYGFQAPRFADIKGTHGVARNVDN